MIANTYIVEFYNESLNIYHSLINTYVLMDWKYQALMVILDIALELESTQTQA